MSLTGHRSDVPTMMEDIEESMGWPALERLLYGGVTGALSVTTLAMGVYADICAL